VHERGDDAVALPSEHGTAVAAGFDDFFHRESARLFRALYFVTASREDAEELMQDAFLKLWERWDRIERIDDPTAYLFRVALNAFRSRVRRTRIMGIRATTVRVLASQGRAAIRTA
jgi:DNA-directed RNA polymerase specialized sigma24 family protein